MARILMCEPTHYGIEYEINPWMSVMNQADRTLAIRQWQSLVNILNNIGVDVDVMLGEPKLPDIVFTANAGVKVGDSVILANFKYPERQPERAIYSNWFVENGFTVVHLPELSFEGAGDCLANGNTLYFGHGFRSDEKVYNHPLWESLGVTCKLLRLVDPYFYHLDTCFCPLARDYALIYPDAFEKVDLPELKLLVVPKDEAAHFACNAVCVDDNVVIPSGCPETAKMLEAADFTVYDTEMTEFIKAGGACKCLTLRID